MEWNLVVVINSYFKKFELLLFNVLVIGDIKVNNSMINKLYKLYLLIVYYFNSINIKKVILKNYFLNLNFIRNLTTCLIKGNA